MPVPRTPHLGRAYTPDACLLDQVMEDRVVRRKRQVLRVSAQRLPSDLPVSDRSRRTVGFSRRLQALVALQGPFRLCPDTVQIFPLDRPTANNQLQPRLCLQRNYQFLNPFRLPVAPDVCRDDNFATCVLDGQIPPPRTIAAHFL